MINEINMDFSYLIMTIHLRKILNIIDKIDIK